MSQTMDTGGGSDEGPHRPVRTSQVIGGAVVGFLSSWFFFAITTFSLYAAYGDSSSRTVNVLAGVGLFALPVVLGLLLVPRRTRHLGAGFLLGSAVGAMTASGICAGFITLGG